MKLPHWISRVLPTAPQTGTVTKSSGSALFPWNVAPPAGPGLSAPTLVDPYRNSPYVQAAIRMIAQPISSVPLRFYRAASATNPGEALLSHGPLIDFWARPAGDTMDAQDFWEATVGWLLLHGEAFWITDDSWLLHGTRQRNPLIIARPDRMRPVVNQGVVQGWEWTDTQGTSRALLPEQVTHLKFWNPYDPHRGLAPYLAAALAAEADWLGSRFLRTLMQNNGDMGGYLIAKGAPPTEDQRDQILRALREKKELSLRGIHKPMFLTGEISVENAQVQSADASLVATRHLLREEIALAFGIPPSRFLTKQNYSIGSASDRFALIEETCMPIAAKLAGAVERLSNRVPAWKTGKERLLAAFDWSEHSTMQAARRERFTALDKLWNKGVPLRVCSDVLDLGLPRVAGDETGYLPSNLTPIPNEPEPNE